MSDYSSLPFFFAHSLYTDQLSTVFPFFVKEKYRWDHFKWYYISTIII